MSAHLLHLRRIVEGDAEWHFTCEHMTGADRWRYRLPNGDIDPNSDSDECWLRSWWDCVGAELLDVEGPILAFPIAVKPSPDWDYDNGGTLVFDDGIRKAATP